MLIQFIILIFGFTILIKGADLLTNGASNIAKKFHIPDVIIGITIVAIGTSMPELFISISSAISGSSDLALANAIGSNICNLLFVLGLSSIINPINMDIKNTENYICFSLFAVVLILAMGNISSIITRTDGAILLTCFILFLIYSITLSLKDIKTTPANLSSKSTQATSLIVSVISIVIGILLLKFGGDFVVDSSTAIAKAYNISEKVIGLTIVAVGTSLPELATSIIARNKNNSGIAVGNIIGSNIINIFLIIGVSAIIRPINYSNVFNPNIILLIISTLAFWIFKYIGEKNTVTRSKGFLLLATYIANTIILFI